MPFLIKSFLLIIFFLSIALACIGKFATYGCEEDMDSQYYNAEGDHIYYERSLIEKKMFLKQFPQISLRKLSNLFRAKGK